MIGESRRRAYAGPCVVLLVSALLGSGIPARAASKLVDLDGDGTLESTVVVQVLQTWPPEIRNSIFNNSGNDRLFSWLNAGPGGFTSNAVDGGEIRWTWQTAQTVYSFTGMVCRNDLCTFGRDGSQQAGAFGVPGRSVVIGQATTSSAALTSSLIQSFSPGQTLLTCTSSVARLANGNFAYTTTCTNLTGESLSFEIDAQPLGCCDGTDTDGNPNQLRCDVDVVIEPDDPETEEFDPITGRESVCFDYLSDNDNCGDCGVECLDSEVCDAGSCEAICPAGTTWCNGSPHGEDAQCVDLSNDPDNCGACGEVCTSTPSTFGAVDAICVDGDCERCPLGEQTRCGNTCVDLDSDFGNCGACGTDCGEVCPEGGVCDDGRSCVCNDTSKSATIDALRLADSANNRPGRVDRLGETVLREAPTSRVAGSTAKDGTIPPPAPLCESPAQQLIVANGETLSECFASPNIPIEVEGQLKACGGLIPEGSPLCGAAFGSAGVFQQFEPSMLLPEAVELSVEDVQITDGAIGNGLIEPGDTACFRVTVASAGTATLTGLTATLSSDPIDLECGTISGRDCEPDGDELSEVAVVSGQALYPDLTGIGQTDPDNSSCFDDAGAPLPLSSLTPGTNDVEFCIQVPPEHPGDVVRPFMLEFAGFDTAGEPFVKPVVFSLGIGSICDFAAGDFPDTVVGPGGGLAGFAPVGTFPPPVADGSITSGGTLPLTIAMTCGGNPVTDSDIAFGPQIVSVIGEAQGDVTPAERGFTYDEMTAEWGLALDTAALAADNVTVTVRVADAKDYFTTFEWCDDRDADGSNDCDDLCGDDPDKDDPGICGCGVADTDADEDGVPACNEACDDDPDKLEPGTCGCGNPDTDADEDGTPVCNDACDDDPDKLEPGTCGCGNPDTDADEDGTPVCNDACDDDPDKLEPGTCGCGNPDTDADEDGTPVCNDACDDDPDKLEPGTCGCGNPDTDADEDGTPVCNDACDDDPDKLEPGTCGCGNPDTDADEDGTPVCNDACDDDPDKLEPGTCGCGNPDTDADEDGTPVCNDACDDDPDKLEPGTCGCGNPDTDADEDGTPVCNDACDDDPDKLEPGTCGCGNPDTDADEDGTPVCNDACDDDPDKLEPGTCGCGNPDTDADEDGTPVCNDACDDDPDKLEPGTCGCGVPDTDFDEDGTPACNDTCDEDPDKLEPGICGCGTPDADTDEDGVENCNDNCPMDGSKLEPGECGCGNLETDTDMDGAPDCVDPCGNGILDLGEECDDGNAVDDDLCSNECVITFQPDVCVCHRVPGYPGLSRTICGNSAAVEPHLAHGDMVGECPDNGDDDDDDDDNWDYSDTDGGTQH